MGLEECLGRSELARVYPKVSPILDFWLERGCVKDELDRNLCNVATLSGREIVRYFDKYRKGSDVRPISRQEAVALARVVFEEVGFKAVRFPGGNLTSPGFLEKLALKGERYPENSLEVNSVARLVYVLSRNVYPLEEKVSWNFYLTPSVYPEAIFLPKDRDIDDPEIRFIAEEFSRALIDLSLAIFRIRSETLPV